MTLRTQELGSALARFGACLALAAAPGAARAAAVPGCEIERTAMQVHEQLAERMPGLASDVRHALAHTLLAEAKRARLDPLLVLALIHVESRFDSEAESDAGAVGLMQLRVPTFQRELALHGLPGGDPRDPIANVQAGLRYLRRLLDAFGDVDVALMAYNAGPNRILAHLRAGEIPERFHDYPRRICGELARLRSELRIGARPAPLAAAPRRPVLVAAAD